MNVPGLVNATPSSLQFEGDVDGTGTVSEVFIQLSPLNGPCPLPWYYWIPGASFFSGIGLIIAGTILLIVARSMKHEQKTDAAITQTPADE